MARGIQNTILTDDGLRQHCGAHQPLRMPVRVDVRLRGGLAAQFKVSTSTSSLGLLSNAARHASRLDRGGSRRTQWPTTCSASRYATTAPAAPSFTGGTGLAGLKDRVEALGGRIFLDSPPGAGTSLRVELPLAPRAAGRLPTEDERRLLRRAARGPQRDVGEPARAGQGISTTHPIRSVSECDYCRRISPVTA